ncbi:MAG TPA: hypothetical protein VFK52_03735 [Nocardioidaceae bacterium]|nr:hypothetical protein [Nocardioidaceae bacterium]
MRMRSLIPYVSLLVASSLSSVLVWQVASADDVRGFEIQGGVDGVQCPKGGAITLVDRFDDDAAAFENTTSPTTAYEAAGRLSTSPFFLAKVGSVGRLAMAQVNADSFIFTDATGRTVGGVNVAQHTSGAFRVARIEVCAR